MKVGDETALVHKEYTCGRAWGWMLTTKERDEMQMVHGWG